MFYELIMEDSRLLNLSDELSQSEKDRLSEIFGSVIERFGISVNSVEFLRYQRSSLFDKTVSITKYDLEKLKE